MAGVDCSTQATKVVVVEVESGRIVASGRAPHAVTGSGGARESDPGDWWQSLAGALAETGRARLIEAISVAGQQHGLVVLGADGGPLRPAILWNDTRPAADAVALTEALGGARAWADLVGTVPVAALTVAKWAWLRRTEPRLARRAAGVRLPHDAITERLTGRATTDWGDASGTGWWSAAERRYRRQVLDLPLIELDPKLLPEPLAPGEIAGPLLPRPARELGLAPGILVGQGTGDNMASALGLDIETGVPVVSLGTSGTAFAVTESASADATGTLAGFADATGRFLPLACTLNCTLAIDRVADSLGLDREDVARDTDITFLPYFDGERTPNLPEARGVLSGLTNATTRQEILLAAYRGVAASLVLAIDAISRHTSGLAREAPIILVGGGARGAAWRRVLQDLSGRPLRIPEDVEAAAYGAAAQAAGALAGRAATDVAHDWSIMASEELPARPRDTGALERMEAAIADLGGRIG